MTAVLLDTNICIYAMKGDERVLAMLLSHVPGDVHISAVTEAELRVGAAKRQHPQKTRSLVEKFIAPLQVIEFGSDEAIAYATIRAALEKAGTPIGPLDTLIAATAVSRGLTLVTNNTAEFRRVKGLVVENWT